MPDIDKHLINMYDLLLCLTKAVDLVSPELANHHQKVAYLAFKIAEQMGIPEGQKRDLVLAGLLHDIGALSVDERLELLFNEPPTSQNHAVRGAKLLEGFLPLQSTSEIIKYHHIPWNNGEGSQFGSKEVPMSSHILHLADRIAVSIDNNRDIISQIQDIKNKIQVQKNANFLPEAVDAFMEISDHEYIWLDLTYKPLLYFFPQIVSFDVMHLNIDEVIDLTRIFSFIIDSNSYFTANHSAGVAATAEKLAELAGFSKKDCKMMRVAGYLHDLGKLAVSSKILEKPDKLSSDEFNEVRSHSFYTFRLLQSINGFEIINEWASFHHEKLNGNGYPFHLNGDSLSLGSRIMAVADIFAAITEDRPYRKGMTDKEAISILNDKVNDGSICPHVVAILLNNYELLNNIRRKAQDKAAKESQALTA